MLDWGGCTSCVEQWGAIDDFWKIYWHDQSYVWFKKNLEGYNWLEEGNR